MRYRRRRYYGRRRFGGYGRRRTYGRRRFSGLRRRRYYVAGQRY